VLGVGAALASPRGEERVATEGTAARA